jgi:CheY-like chemotaxis protein
MNILTVDDRWENNFMLTTLLEGKGNQVSSAGNGAEA